MTVLQYRKEIVYIIIMSEEERKKVKKSKRKHDHYSDDKKEKKRAKRAEKKALLEQLPKTDEDGIAYTKLQLRRMMKRVKRGLSPIPTREEEQELKRQEAETRKEEEQVLAGLADTIDDVEGDGINSEEDDDVNDDIEEQQERDVAAAVDKTEATAANESAEPQSQTRHKKKRSKPVPPDYVCQACKNEHEPAHWIYDCPNKITMKGTNHISKKLKGLHAPDSRKVFVSGLAFDMKKRDVEALFKECGTVVHCKLLTFPDTGRCKGQAYVTFDSDASAKKAMKLSGTMIANDDDNEEQSKKKKKKFKQESPSKRKDLKLKVTKVLNRTQTKHAAKAT